MGVIKYDSKVRDCGCDAWHFYLIRACYIILEHVSFALSSLPSPLSRVRRAVGVFVRIL